jgi:hypothetical protein
MPLPAFGECILYSFISRASRVRLKPYKALNEIFIQKFSFLDIFREKEMNKIPSLLLPW